MTIRSFAALVIALAAGASSVGAGGMDRPAASPPPPTARVRILSPADGAIVVGSTRLRAEVEPSDASSSVIFFVDGLKVCTVAKPPFECEWDAGSMITQHLVRLVVNLTAGGRVVRTTRTAAARFAEMVDVDIVQVTVTVTDDRGRYVQGLTRSAFHISEDGRPQTISHFFPKDAAMELVVAVDMSESMAPVMSTLKEAVSDFLTAVPPQHAVTLLGFNNEVFTLARRAGDAAERVKAVEALTSWGSTVLYDVILHGTDLLDSRGGRKALVVFTDGNDSQSYAAIEEVERRLQRSDLALYMIGQGEGITNAPLKQVMERLSRPTGGRAFFTERIDELRAIFGELLEELSQQYELGYQSTNRARDGAWRQIKVDVDGQPRIRARQGYRAPSSSQRR